MENIKEQIKCRGVIKHSIKNPIMKIFKTTEYKGKEILYRQITKTLFEYLFVYNNKIYTSHINVIPLWYRRFRRKPFTEKQEKSTLIYLKCAAETTIDYLEKKPIDKKNK